MSDQSDRWFLRAASGGAIKAIFYKITLVYLIPIGIPIVTAVLGWSQGLPWMYIALGAMAAFAFITNGLLRFDEWRLQRRVEDKLTFSSVLVGRSVSDGGIIVGLQLMNSATFSIEFEMTKLTTRLGTIVPKDTKYNVKNVTVPPHGTGWFYDHPIFIDNPPHPGTIEGFIEYEIKYGRGNVLKYRLSGKKQIVASFDPSGLLTHGAWLNAA